MQVEKAQEFLRTCCRVCLAVEHEMVDTVNIVENFSKSIAQLLLECADIQDASESQFPTTICEDCTAELVLVAKFREKCAISSAALLKLTKDIELQTRAAATAKCVVIKQMCKPSGSKPTAGESNLASGGEIFIEFDDDNVEYVMLETTEHIDNANGGEQAHNVDVHHDAQQRQRLNESGRETIEIMEDTRTTQKTTINHSCKLCGAGFAQLNNYQRHLLTHSDNEMSSAEQVTCSHCDESFANEIQLAEHKKSHDAMTQASIQLAAIEGTAQKKSSAKRRKTSERNHKCKYCDRAFPTQSLLTTHVRIHTGERPFVCKTCPKTFKTQGALDLHARRHSGFKPYQCDMCDRSFVESSNLKVHMRTHTGEKPHQCTRCGRSFSRVFLLQIHQRTHTGEKPYACDTCNRSFAQQGDLSAHKRIHSGERPHRCKICNRGFIKSSGLTQHMRRHSRLLSKLEEAALNEQETESGGNRSTDDFDEQEEHDPLSSQQARRFKDQFHASVDSYAEYLES